MRPWPDLPERAPATAGLADAGYGEQPPDLSHSITYRIALGPRAGQKAFTLQSLPGPPRPEPSKPFLASADGFSLHAGVAAGADDRKKVERLCRYIARPAIATGRLSPAASAPALAGGSNYAFGGARTGAGTSPVPGLLAQAGGLWSPAHPAGADPTGLYVVVGGGNDMRDARSAFQTNSVADQAGRQAAAQTAANSLISVRGFLAG